MILTVDANQQQQTNKLFQDKSTSTAADVGATAHDILARYDDDDSEGEEQVTDREEELKLLDQQLASTHLTRKEKKQMRKSKRKIHISCNPLPHPTICTEKFAQPKFQIPSELCSSFGGATIHT